MDILRTATSLHCPGNKISLGKYMKKNIYCTFVPRRGGLKGSESKKASSVCRYSSGWQRLCAACLDTFHFLLSTATPLRRQPATMASRTSPSHRASSSLEKKSAGAMTGLLANTRMARWYTSAVLALKSQKYNMAVLLMMRSRRGASVLPKPGEHRIIL